MKKFLPAILIVAFAVGFTGVASAARQSRTVFVFVPTVVPEPVVSNP